MENLHLAISLKPGSYVYIRRLLLQCSWGSMCCPQVWPIYYMAVTCRTQFFTVSFKAIERSIQCRQVNMWQRSYSSFSNFWMKSLRISLQTSLKIFNKIIVRSVYWCIILSGLKHFKVYRKGTFQQSQQIKSNKKTKQTIKKIEYKIKNMKGLHPFLHQMCKDFSRT